MRTLAKGVAINVGVNTNPKWGGFRGPIFPNGIFKFIHIPWKQKYGRIKPRPPKYSEMSYSAYIPEGLLGRQVLVSPDFQNYTYASTTNAPANKPINGLKQGDFLLFYATLNFRDDGSKRENWINPRWGAYLVGLFKIDSIYESLSYVLADEDAIEAFKEYAWFKSSLNWEVSDDDAPWVKGIEGESGLLDKAIPLSNHEFSQKWSDLACNLFRTSRGKRLDVNKKAVFRTILTCEGERLDKLLDQCVLRKNN